MSEDLTPKERAKELLDKHKEAFQLKIDNFHHKKSALITVNEIIEVMTFYNIMDDNDWINKFQYWYEVKQEIEKL